MFPLELSQKIVLVTTGMEKAIDQKLAGHSFPKFSRDQKIFL
jgi:hypothetical protein